MPNIEFVGTKLGSILTLFTKEIQGRLLKVDLTHIKAVMQEFCLRVRYFLSFFLALEY